MTTTIHIFCENIPASSSSPFEIVMNEQTIFQHAETLSRKIKKKKKSYRFCQKGNPICIDAEVPEPKFGSNLLVYLGIKIPEKNIDEVKEYSIFKHGDHIHLSYSENEGLVTKQRNDDDFE